MQVTVDHSIAGSQAISGRTPFFSHTPGTFNQSWVLTQPASRATPLVEAPPTPQQQLAFPQRHFSADAVESIFHYLNNPTHNLAPPNFGIIPLRCLPTIESPTGFSGPKLRVWVPSASVPGCECQQHRLV